MPKQLPEEGALPAAESHAPSSTGANLALNLRTLAIPAVLACAAIGCTKDDDAEKKQNNLPEQVQVQQNPKTADGQEIAYSHDPVTIGGKKVQFVKLASKEGVYIDPETMSIVDLKTDDGEIITRISYVDETIGGKEYQRAKLQSGKWVFINLENNQKLKTADGQTIAKIYNTERIGGKKYLDVKLENGDSFFIDPDTMKFAVTADGQKIVESDDPDYAETLGSKEYDRYELESGDMVFLKPDTLEIIKTDSGKVITDTAYIKQIGDKEYEVVELENGESVIIDPDDFTVQHPKTANGQEIIDMEYSAKLGDKRYQRVQLKSGKWTFIDSVSLAVIDLKTADGQPIIDIKHFVETEFGGKMYQRVKLENDKWVCIDQQTRQIFKTADGEVVAKIDYSVFGTYKLQQAELANGSKVFLDPNTLQKITTADSQVMSSASEVVALGGAKYQTVVLADGKKVIIDPDTRAIQKPKTADGRAIKEIYQSSNYYRSGDEYLKVRLEDDSWISINPNPNNETEVKQQRKTPDGQTISWLGRKWSLGGKKYQRVSLGGDKRAFVNPDTLAIDNPKTADGKTFVDIRGYSSRGGSGEGEGTYDIVFEDGTRALMLEPGMKTLKAPNGKYITSLGSVWGLNGRELQTAYTEDGTGVTIKAVKTE